jgi:hypothetical protein
MAQVTVKNKQVEKIVKVDEKTIVLELNPKEAMALLILTGRVGHAHTINYVTDDIWDKLNSVMEIPCKYYEMYLPTLIKFESLPENPERCVK